MAEGGMRKVGGMCRMEKGVCPDGGGGRWREVEVPLSNSEHKAVSSSG